MQNDSRGLPISLASNIGTAYTRITNTIPSKSNMESFSLLEGIQLDPRPTFVVDMDCPDSSSQVLLLNPALKARPNLYHALQKTTHILGEFTQLTQPFLLHGLEWDHYTMGGRWTLLSTGAQCADIQIPWTGSASIRPSKYPSKHENSQTLPPNSSLKRKTSDEGLASRLTSPPAPFIIPQEYSQFLNSFDWESMKLGPIQTWQRQLREWFMMILVDPRPACIYWGEHGAQSEELIMLYNEPHVAILGDHNPAAMGRSIEEVFPLHWKEMHKPLFDEMIRTRRPFIQRSLPVSYTINGPFVEERYFDWTSMPIVDHMMEVTGSYQSLLDVTDAVLEQRRARSLSSMGAIVTNSELENIWDRITQNISENQDLPQALIYSLTSGKEDPASSVCKLEGSVACKQSVGLENIQIESSDHVIAKFLRYSMTLNHPLYISNRKSCSRNDLWLQVSPEDHRQTLSNLLPTLLNEFKLSPSGDMCDSIAIMPIRLSNSHQVRGFVIVGLNARLPYDHTHASFIGLLQQTISTTISSALLWREDRLMSKEAELAHADLSAQLLRSTQETKAIESRFSQLARHAPIGICIYAADGAMAFVNAKWYSLTDFSPEADNKSPGWWAPIVYPADMGVAFESFSQLQIDKQAVHFEIRLAVPSKQFPSSKITWVLVSAYPELREGEDLESIVACFTDITEQKLAAETERKRREEAVEAKRQQESFIDVTSHEIRNPLSVSLQCSEEISSITNAALLDMRADATEVCLPSSELRDILNAAECIEQCTMHQRRIVDDILTMSKLEGGMLPFNLSPVQPMLVVKDVLKIFSRESVYSGIEIKLLLDPSLEMVNELESLELDPGRLSQMLINLLTNAIKFTKTQSRRLIEITVGASKELESLKSNTLQYLPVREIDPSRIGSTWNVDETVFIHILVADSGSGIPDEDQESVFSRFSQGSTKDYTQYGGSGLGLYICRALVEIHGGQIGFKSCTGKGSTFGFCLKSRRVPQLDVKLPTFVPSNGVPKMSNGNTSTAEPNSNSTFSILIVEDNEINRKVLSKQLKKAGHEVTIANHGQECLGKLAESHFCKPDGTGTKLSIVLMDVEMPVMNGIECTKAIRDMEKDGKIQGHVPIISTTGNARSEKVDLIKEAGVDRVILKPYSVSDLLVMIREVIGGG